MARLETLMDLSIFRQILLLGALCAGALAFTADACAEAPSFYAAARHHAAAGTDLLYMVSDDEVVPVSGGESRALTRARVPFVDPAGVARVDAALEQERAVPGITRRAVQDELCSVGDGATAYSTTRKNASPAAAGARFRQRPVRAGARISVIDAPFVPSGHERYYYRLRERGRQAAPSIESPCARGKSIPIASRLAAMREAKLRTLPHYYTVSPGRPGHSIPEAFQ